MRNLRPAATLLMFFALLAAPAYAKWPQDTPPDKKNEDVALTATGTTACDCKIPIVQCAWMIPEKRPVAPDEALKAAVEDAVAHVNRDLTHGITFQTFKPPIAHQIAKRFREMGWQVTTTQDQLLLGVHLEFSWPEAK